MIPDRSVCLMMRCRQWFGEGAGEPQTHRIIKFVLSFSNWIPVF